MNYLVAIALDDGTYQYLVIQASNDEEAEIIAENLLKAIKLRELWDSRKHGCDYNGLYTEDTYINVISPIKC